MTECALKGMEAHDHITLEITQDNRDYTFDLYLNNRLILDRLDCGGLLAALQGHSHGCAQARAAAPLKECPFVEIIDTVSRVEWHALGKA